MLVNACRASCFKETVRVWEPHLVAVFFCDIAFAKLVHCKERFLVSDAVMR